MIFFSEALALDLFYTGISLEKKLDKTLAELQLPNNGTVEVKVRWIGGVNKWLLHENNNTNDKNK